MRLAPTSLVLCSSLLLTGANWLGGPSPAAAGTVPDMGTVSPNVPNQTGTTSVGQTVRVHFTQSAAQQKCMRVAVAGVHMRNAHPAPPTASGTIVLPPGPAAGNVIWAGLYWEILGDQPPVNAVKLNGTAVTPQALPVTPSPCWPEQAAYPYFADVTGLVVAGANNVDGLDDSDSLGFGYNAEGASLVVVYQSGTSTACEIIVTDGNDLLSVPVGQHDNPLPVTCQPDQPGRLYFIGADGQAAADNQLWNGVALGDGDDFDNSDPGAPGSSSLVGWDSDQMPGGYPVTVLPPFTASVNNLQVGGNSDCVNWLVTVLEVGPHDSQCSITRVRTSTWGQLKKAYR
jgi:hypothetical protein